MHSPAPSYTMAALMLHDIIMGSPTLCRHLGVRIDPGLHEKSRNLNKQGGQTCRLDGNQVECDSSLMSTCSRLTLWRSSKSNKLLLR